MNRLAPILLLSALACARSKAPPRAADSGSSLPPSLLRASLVSPTRIALAWQHQAPEPAGYWIEFTTPGADFVKLDVAWPERTTFSHEDLAPDTTFMYRLVPFFGRASAVITVVSGRAGAAPLEPEGPLAQPGPSSGVPGRSLRSAAMAEAAPDDLTVTLTAPTTAVLRWSDRAADEDGFLVELAQGEEPFQVCALLPPDSSSFRKVMLPPQKELRFRVRAFFLGPPSPVASAATPSQPR